MLLYSYYIAVTSPTIQVVLHRNLNSTIGTYVTMCVWERKTKLITRNRLQSREKDTMWTNNYIAKYIFSINNTVKRWKEWD